ncbi:MAG: histidine phosphatase family protein [Okeania sp. SIO3H1]|uniref:histidine phosphatase family protein n=1 Tax=Okeania sp. SIO1I7 TaxID=2607772 RepID=UPI0013C85F02|nr:histidine phosphatase family protein [Okeania sp. SIO1I7]NEN89953.1 histidine phosphatase family protein [Okeania sp. SIO3H1]NET29210.1 histidine phosphatase family protein [Okeania sp. SIO1I7]
MSLKLYFIRHGETTYSKTGGYCGILDPELTPEGLDMAEKFAKTHSSLNWTAAYISPMKRTIATAKPALVKRVYDINLNSLGVSPQESVVRREERRNRSRRKKFFGERKGHEILSRSYLDMISYLFLPKNCGYVPPLLRG